MTVEQRTQYRVGDRLSNDFDDAIVVSPDAVLALARAHCKTIAPGFVLGVAMRESSKNGKLCANMVCTDYDEHGRERPAKTFGLLQIREDEAAAIEPACLDLCDPAANVRIGVAKFERALAEILKAAGLHVVTGDVLKYVAFAHNCGLAAAVKSITIYDLDWPEFVNRKQPPTVRSRVIPYCNAVAEYAARYPLEPGTAAG